MAIRLSLALSLMFWELMNVSVRALFDGEEEEDWAPLSGTAGTGVSFCGPVMDEYHPETHPVTGTRCNSFSLFDTL